MKRILTLVCLMFALNPIQNLMAECTDWTQTSGVSCIFAGGSGNLWERQCDDLCSIGRRGQGYGPQCNNETICMPSDSSPNQLSRACTDWVREGGVTCRNPNTGNWEQHWVRSCQTGLSTTWCSDEDPNNL